MVPLCPIEGSDTRDDDVWVATQLAAHCRRNGRSGERLLALTAP